MQTGVATIDRDATLLDAHRLFVEEEIHGAPVVDADGTVVGVISTLDILRAVREEHESATADPTYYRDVLEFSGPDWASGPEDFQDRLSELRVGDAMTESVVSVPPEASIAEIARLLRANRIHRVLVSEGDQLVGIVSTFDLVEVLEKG
ncbi:MAG TPA: CBS domain-containing protein [Myxococcota bacterium]|nr:CBS domain-containing protein [Myxococcota bacterium]